ncbi:MAG: phosphoribosyl-ATP diphosphatase [Clostridiales bacterium]|nr:phosphoribosyl-ATP diphosphatase [Clostridiales bacterium]
MQDAFNCLYDVILQRKANPMEGSYTCYLFEQGIDKILKKCGEECAETIIAAKNADKKEIIYEISDLIFHLTVLMAQAEVTPDDIAAELKKRSAKTGNLKAIHQADKNT